MAADYQKYIDMFVGFFKKAAPHIGEVNEQFGAVNDPNEGIGKRIEKNSLRCCCLSCIIIVIAIAAIVVVAIAMIGDLVVNK